MKGAFLLKKMCVFDKFYPFLIKSLLGIPYLFINHFICNTTFICARTFCSVKWFHKKLDKKNLIR